MADLIVDIAGLKLKNPVMTASGTHGAGNEYGQLVDLSSLGALVVKTLTLKPVTGNPPPRICETPSGLLNSIGLQNPGIESWLAEELPDLVALGVPIIVSIAGETVDDYSRLAKMLDGVDAVAAIEANVSCPNVKAGGAIFGANPKMAAEVVSKTRLATSKPLIVKLTPNVGDIVAVALAVERAGAQAISLINTLLGMAVDVDARRPMLGAITGGLSGPAIKPIALRMVWQVASRVRVPVIGMGGISSARDALEFLIAGATAVAIGTASFVDPQAPAKVIQGIGDYLDNRRFASVYDIIGTLNTNGQEPA